MKNLKNELKKIFKELLPTLVALITIYIISLISRNPVITTVSSIGFVLMYLATTYSNYKD